MVSRIETNLFSRNIIEDRRAVSIGDVNQEMTIGTTPDLQIKR